MHSFYANYINLVTVYIKYLCVHSIRTNCINLVIITLLHCWPLYVRYLHTHFVSIISILSPSHYYIVVLLYVKYSRAHFMPITSILSLRRHCNASYHYPITLLYHCTNVFWMISYSYALVIHFYIPQSCHRRITAPPTAPK